VQINLVIDVILASLLPEGALSFLFYADRLNQLPLGVIGIAVGTALLPLLSRQLSAGETRAAMANHNRAVEVAMLFALPAAVALLLIPEALVGGLFQRGAFSPADTEATALALGAYAVGTPAYILIKVFVPGFYAREDTTTPVKFAMIALGVNVVLNIALMIPFEHMGLALATALSAWLNAALLGTTLRKRGHFIADDRLRWRLPRIGAAALLMGLALLLAAAGIGPLFPPDQIGRIGLVVVLVTGGIVLYFALARQFAVFTFAELRGLLRRRGGEAA
jgi:putative peptidoglycan lipid II flippase